MMEKEDNKEFKEEIKTSENPWDVPNLEEFLYYCCPECDSFKSKDSADFVKHALMFHEQAKHSLVPVKHAIESVNIENIEVDVKPELPLEDLESYDEIEESEKDSKSWKKYKKKITRKIDTKREIYLLLLFFFSSIVIIS